VLRRQPWSGGLNVNIFVLDRDPGRAARYHCDKHVVRMVLETAQLLSTALWAVDEPSARRLERNGLIYRPTHRRHPCALWTAQCPGNYRWLARLGMALVAEYQYRYEARHHRSAPVIEYCADSGMDLICRAQRDTGGRRRRTPFALAMPGEYKSADAVASYRRYYLAEKAPFCCWTRRRVPRWFSEGLCD